MHQTPTRPNVRCRIARDVTIPIETAGHARSRKQALLEGIALGLALLICSPLIAACINGGH